MINNNSGDVADLWDELRRLATALYQRATWSDAEEVTVTFLAANTDQDVPHTLSVENPENIRYVIIRKDRACDIYDNQTSGTRRAWTKNYITLRSTVAGATVMLRLTSK
jgi:hypothetical protein